MSIFKLLTQAANKVLNLYSKGCEYAIRVLVQAIQEDTPFFSIHKLCRRMKISESFTRKVFQSLARQGILTSVRGPHGGYAFESPAPNISLYDLILAIDGKDAFGHCVMGLPECHDKNPCVFHSTWKKMREDAISRLSQQTLLDLAQADKRKKREKRQ